MLFDTKFESKSELYNWILESPNGYHRILSTTEMYKSIKIMYTGTKNIGENFWLYCHDHAVPKTCECGKKLLFENVVKGYKSEKCWECYSIDRFDNGLVETKKKTQSITPPLCANPACKDAITKTPKPVMVKKDGVWSSYCSKKCRGQGNSLLSRATSASTNLVKRGVEHHRQDPVESAEFNLTIKDRYGVSNIIKIPGAIGTRDATNLELYGYENVLSSPEIQKQIVQTNIEKYGYPNVSQSPLIQIKKVKSSYRSKKYQFGDETIYCQGDEPIVIAYLRQVYSREDFIFEVLEIPYVDSSKNRVYHPDFNIVGMIAEVKSDFTLKADKNTNMLKFSTAAENNDFALFVTTHAGKQIFSTTRNVYVNKLSEKLKDLGFDEYVTIDNKFFDFYHKEQNLFIRIVDPRVHNEHLQDRDFFRNTEIKDSVCYYYSLQSITDNYELVLVSILTKLRKNNLYIHGRKCNISEVEWHVASSFYNSTHLQGAGNPANKSIALYYNNEIVACMSFSKPRDEKQKDNGCMILSRYSSRDRINGGASKLLKYYINNYSPTSVVSYSDNMYSNGGLYRSLGFSVLVDRRPDYKYSSKGSMILKHKTNYALNKVKNLPEYRAGQSEYDFTFKNNLFRTYDCGKKTWILNIK